MERKVFIHTNGKQLFGARIARFALQKNMRQQIPVEILDTDHCALFREFAGVRYKRGGAWTAYDPSDLQSFTLARFMAPELMGYGGMAAVIDPDIFALADIGGLFAEGCGGSAIACCRKKDAWDTSVMLLDCAELGHWNMKGMLDALRAGTADYRTLMTLADVSNIRELGREWNSLDKLDTGTRMVHMTNRLTQPWKTGLPVDFTVIGKKWYLELLGRYPERYQEHPDARIREFFFANVREALDA